MDKNLGNYQKRIVDLENANQALQAQLALYQQAYREALQELQQIRHELQTVHTQSSITQQAVAIAGATDGISIFSQAGFTYLNQAHVELFGYDSPQELLGKSWQILYNASEIDRLTQEVFPVLIQQGSWQGEATAQRKDGSTFTQEVSLNVMENGTFICIFRDITQRKQTELALQRLNEDLEQRVDARTRELQTSKARLQRLAANLPGLIFQFCLNADGTRSFPYVSEGCRDIYELEPEHFLHCFDLVHPRDRDALEQAIQVSAFTLAGFHHENRIITPSGQLKWVQTIARPEKKADDTILWDGLIIEISDRKRAEKKQQQLLSILEATPDVVCIANAEGNHLYLNYAGQQLLEIAAEEIEQVNIRECHPPDILKMIQTEAVPAALQAGMWQGESRLKSRSGREVPVSQVLLAHWDEDGNLEFLSSIMRDISQKTQLEAERNRQEQALRSIVKGTATQTGAAFFQACVEHLALALNMQYALIAEVTDTGEQLIAKTLAFWNHSDFGDNFQYNLAGTPCFNIFRTRAICRYGSSVQKLFPTDSDLIALNAESYVGIPVLNPSGHLLGLIAVISTEPIEYDLELQSFILEIFAARVGAEIERMQVEKALVASNEQVQQQAQREQLLNQIANQIRTSLDLDHILNTTVQEIQSFLGVDRCHFAWHVHTADASYWDVITEVQSPDLPSFIGPHLTTRFGSLTDKLLCQQIVRIDNIETIDDANVKAVLMGLGNKSMLVLPVRAESGKVGIIACIHSRDLRPWLEDEVELLKAVVGQLEIALNQADLLAQSQARSQELEVLLTQLQRTQSQLVQSEKMSSLGQMVAGVAHEINNPVSFIYGNLLHAKDYTQNLVHLIDLYQHHYPQTHPDIGATIDEIELDFLKLDLPQLFQSMEVGTERIREIIQSLRTFSRLDEAEIKKVNLHDGIDSSLTILHTRLRAQPWRPKIQVIKEYGELPQVECYAGQLNQVFMNLLSNAIDALEERDQDRSWQQMEDKPSIIQIRTHLLQKIAGQSVEIAITDNGPGISQHLLEYLFNPFFTTKPVGKGTGLGLSISYQIITETHDGTIICNSELGQGTTFNITLPIKQ